MTLKRSFNRNIEKIKYKNKATYQFYSYDVCRNIGFIIFEYQYRRNKTIFNLNMRKSN